MKIKHILLIFQGIHRFSPKPAWAILALVCFCLSFEENAVGSEQNLRKANQQLLEKVEAEKEDCLKKISQKKETKEKEIGKPEKRCELNKEAKLDKTKGNDAKAVNIEITHENEKGACHDTLQNILDALHDLTKEKENSCKTAFEAVKKDLQECFDEKCENPGEKLSESMQSIHESNKKTISLLEEKIKLVKEKSEINSKIIATIDSHILLIGKKKKDSRNPLPEDKERSDLVKIHGSKTPSCNPQVDHENLESCMSAMLENIAKEKSEQKGVLKQSEVFIHELEGWKKQENEANPLYKKMKSAFDARAKALKSLDGKSRNDIFKPTADFLTAAAAAKNGNANQPPKGPLPHPNPNPTSGESGLNYNSSGSSALLGAGGLAIAAAGIASATNNNRGNYRANMADSPANANPMAANNTNNLIAEKNNSSSANATKASDTKGDIKLQSNSEKTSSDPQNVKSGGSSTFSSNSYNSRSGSGNVKQNIGVSGPSAEDSHKNSEILSSQFETNLKPKATSHGETSGGSEISNILSQMKAMFKFDELDPSAQAPPPLEYNPPPTTHGTGASAPGQEPQTQSEIAQDSGNGENGGPEKNETLQGEPERSYSSLEFSPDSLFSRVHNRHKKCLQKGMIIYISGGIR